MARAKTTTKGVAESKDDLLEFFREPEPVSLNVSIDVNTKDLLDKRRDQIQELLGEDIENKIDLDKVVEQTILFGLEHNKSFQDYVLKKTGPARSPKNGKNKKKTPQTESNTIDLGDVDASEIDSAFEKIGR